MTTVYTHRLIAVPAAHAAVARSLVQFFANSVTPGAADDMFNVGYRTIGSTGGATDYVSAGLIDAQFAGLLGDAATTFGAYQSMGGTAITLDQIQALYDACPIGTRIRDDAEGNEHECIAALNLEPVPSNP